MAPRDARRCSALAERVPADNAYHAIQRVGSHDNLDVPRPSTEGSPRGKSSQPRRTHEGGGVCRRLQPLLRRPEAARQDTGWRWLDVRALANDLIAAQRAWPGAVVDRVIYCTAQIDQGFNPSGHAEQSAYLQALRLSGSVDHIEFGKYVTGVKVRPLAMKAATRSGAPRLVKPSWPVMVHAPHWWRTLGAQDFLSHQLRDPVGYITKPPPW